MALRPLDERFEATRDVLRVVATHIVARARHQATGRFGLRVTPGGYGTPEFGADLQRVRVAGWQLVREFGGVDGARAEVVDMAGRSLTDLAAVAGVDLSIELSVGHDTPARGAVDQLIEQLDRASAMALGEWFGMGASALDIVVGTVAPAATPSMIQLWPEHFDVAADVAFDIDEPTERRVNLGASAGDDFHPLPYLYVAPWTADRPGDASFWNAPFGAQRGYDELDGEDDPVAAATEFYRTGLAMLALSRRPAR